MRKIAIGLAVCIALASQNASAVNPATNSPFDYRIKTVEYNPLDVVQIDVVQGLHTHIQIAPDEQYVTHAFGASKMWELFTSSNNIFIKATDYYSDTNLTIVTTKRIYYFVVHYVGEPPVKGPDGKVVNFVRTPWKLQQATVGVVFKYPNDDMRVAEKELEDRRIQEALQRHMAQGAKNLDYRMSDDPKSRSIQPLNAWDNGTDTFFKFRPNAELPTLFVIGPDGKEATVNTHVEGEFHNIVVAETTAKEWRIRYGDKVVGVLNGSYNPMIGASRTGTVSREVKRVKKGEGDE